MDVVETLRSLILMRCQMKGSDIPKSMKGCSQCSPSSRHVSGAVLIYASSEKHFSAMLVADPRLG